MTESFSLGVVILAAGASSRMGRPKMLLPWGGTSVLGHLISTWARLEAEQIAVVIAADRNDVHEELDRNRFPSEHRIFNPNPERGMFSSIQAAALWDGWKAPIANWAIVLGDQPHLCDATLRRIIKHAGTHAGEICQPSRLGRPRHPVILPRAVFKALADSKTETLKQFLQSLETTATLCEMDDPGLDFDIDSPADYEQAVQRFSESSRMQ